jgi:predicted dehydrogenase
LAVGFCSTGIVGKVIAAQSQWHRKQSWRQAAASAERKREVNWRLDSERSLGLSGEVAIHHFDAANWFFGARPVAISGRGSLMYWKDDGRDVADTIQLVLEYPQGLRLVESCTLANSFGAESEAVYGTDAALLFRGGRAWMFREVDAPQLEWEIHARKEAFHDQTGLVLVANASKQKATDSEEDPIERALSIPPLQHALQAFVQSALDIEAAVEDFTAAYGTESPAELREHLTAVRRTPGAGWQEGYEAVVMAVKAQEAIVTGQRVELEPDEFELG